MTYEPRQYREAMAPDGLVGFRVVVRETDIQVHAAADLSGPARDIVIALRRDLESYLVGHPRFGESFVPVPVEESAPAIVHEMAAAAHAAGVGPMAAVAGAIAEAVAVALAPLSPEIVVENGGDVFMCGSRDRVIGLVTGGKAGALGLKVPADSLPCAVATSSATVGPSVSLGSADSATVIASRGALADAAASVVGNRVHSEADLEAAIAAGRQIDGVRGVVASIGGKTAAWGQVEFVPVARGVL